ncbi:carbon-nitrogen hydrolase family protein [Aquimarina sp. 2201CG14-23]|uniref:carbon-nitrogen hydrolase family protein n=1 Tax=Aquimarina mycalae TaxID=3040073 RepID=UPI002477E6E9|nr:carbon-nitrogen hydrolase family protein [Aquimarina sp. 2201CG14-23]MDH7447173.1 carbon-nitrogen hydrolase family protein [Aquimarina sp. 2201CG14-23]
MPVKVCLIQDSPVFFDKEKTIDKIETLTKKYSQEGCELIVFPESFIPGYPRGFDFGATVGRRTSEGRDLYAEYYKNSIDLQSNDLKRLEELSASQNIYMVIGATEKQETNGSLYCSMIYISPTLGLLGVHRKIKPTGTERLIWAEAGSESLVTFKTNIGKLGGLICWENYMPLARMSMYQKGVEVYIAPTADSRSVWTATMKHIALEGRCFVLGCNQYYTKSMYPEKYQSLVENEQEDICPGGSIIVSPLGEVIAGPLFGENGTLIATLDLDEINQSKLDFDVIGHYARNDLFDFRVNGQPDIQNEIDNL